MLQGEKYQQSIIQAALLRSFGTSEPLLLSKKAFSDWGKAPKGVQGGRSVEGLNPDHFEIRYADGARRALRRFDFTTEWNNLGFGTIEFSQSVFGLSGLWRVPDTAKVLAQIVDARTDEVVGDYAAIFEDGGTLSLWFARPVGPVDGFDWSYVEQFVSEEQVERYGGCPVICDLPKGFSNGFTMRLDCDENIISARPLFELYRSRNVPFSLAIKTGQPIGEPEQRLLRDILDAGGSIVSHSHTHAPDWGIPAGQADMEIQESRRILESLNLRGMTLDFVVSPFHQNSVGAVQALRDNGIQGFVSGIACNDPEFLMARSGHVPLVDGIVSMSHQCMLHGDCFHQQGSKLDVEMQAFRQTLKTRTLFGYLDHPFSSYQYGWKDEDERLQAHRDFLNFLMDHPDQWRPSLAEAMSFVRGKARVGIRKIGPSEWEFVRRPETSDLSGKIEMRMNGRNWIVA